MTRAQSMIEIVQESINARNYGVMGDGETDDSVALNALLAIGRLVYCPKGLYRATNLVGAAGPQQGGGIVGDGVEQTIINTLNNLDGTDLLTVHRHSFFLQDLTLAGGGNGRGLVIPNYAPKWNTLRVSIRGFDVGIDNDGNDAASINSSVVSSCRIGVRTDGNQDRLLVNGSSINACSECAFDVVGSGALCVTGGVHGGNIVTFRLGSEGASAHLVSTHSEPPENNTPVIDCYIQAGDNARVIGTDMRFADGPWTGQHVKMSNGRATFTGCYHTANESSGPIRVSSRGQVYSPDFCAKVRLGGVRDYIAGDFDVLFADNELPTPTSELVMSKIMLVAYGDVTADRLVQCRQVSAGVFAWVDL